MSPPNVLWIQTDEQRPDSLGCYGSEWAKTPNVDAIARDGIVYRNCVCNSPVCVPSRASQLTCRYPQEIGVVHNHVFALDGVYPADTVTFPQVFAKAGYATASVGKWHTPNHPTWQANDSLINLDQYAGYYALNERYDENAYHVIKRPGGTPIILAGTYPVSQGHPSQVITDRAIEWLRSLPAGCPFLLRVSHNWPHTPVLAPPPFDELYDPDEISIRFYNEQAYRTRARRDRRLADIWRMRDLTRGQVRQMWKDYMGLVACVDHETGRMLSALRDLGMEDNTVVLFSSDHGKSLGEWGATEKGFFDSQVWRVPFVLAGPGVGPRGTVVTDVCELLDTGRTLLTLAGLDVPQSFRGRDLLREPAPRAVYGQIGWPNHEAPLFQRALAERVSEVKSTRGLKASPSRGPTGTSMQVAIRTQRHRMDVTWYQNGCRVPLEQADGNLFDSCIDPYERANLWDTPGAQPVVEELWQELEDWHAGLDRPAQLFVAAR